MTDEKLLKLIKKAPEKGIKALVDEYGALIAAVIRGRLSGLGFGERDVEVCAADTVSEFYLESDKFDPRKGGVRGWLCAMAAHNATDLARKRARERGNIPLDETAELIPDDFSLEGEFESREARAELVEAINALGEPDREIIVRKYYLAQSSKEIAQKLGMTVSNVDVRTHRAVKKLRERFGGES